MTNGLLNLSFWELIGATLLLTHITIVAVTVFLHRAQAHRALHLHPLISHFFRFWLWLTTGQVTKEWVAIHRKHHAKCETADDPHSPQIEGIDKVFWQGTELYRAEAKNQQTLDRYGHGTPDDWLERQLYSRFSGLGIGIMLIIDLLLFGVIGITIWAIQMLWIPIWAAGVINGIGHFWGYRNFETPDAARNIIPVGIIIGGEELHNNHHAFSSSARLSNKWWEFDIGWFYIRLLQCLGLAQVKKVAPKPHRLPEKHSVDLDTLRAVVLNRFHVTSDFARSVMLPVLREELKQADRSCRRLLKRHRTLLVRDQGQLDQQERDNLYGVLQLSQSLRTVHEHRQRLLGLWELTTASHEKLLLALQEWCTQAEASGIEALQEFSRSLRSYSLQAA